MNELKLEQAEIHLLHAIRHLATAVDLLLPECEREVVAGIIDALIVARKSVSCKLNEMDSRTSDLKAPRSPEKDP